MENEQQTQIFENIQRVLLSSSTLGKQTSVLDDESVFAKDNDTYLDEILFQLDPASFDKLVPYLRKSVENSHLSATVDDLYNSIDDNFQGLEGQILQEAQINDKMKTSIEQISNIEELIETSLSQEVSGLQEQLAMSTNEVVRKKGAYLNYKKTSMKITEASILMKKVLRILELANNCQTLILEKDFFKALQHLDHLEKLYLQEFKNYKFQFLKELYASIPLLKSSIKDECINLIKNSFNLNLGKNLLKVSENYFQIYRDQLLPTWLEVRDAMKLSNFKFNSPIEISLRDQSILSQLELEKMFDLDEFHDSILIFKNLNESENLFAELRKEYAYRKTNIIHPLTWKNLTNNVGTDPEALQTDAFIKEMSISSMKAYFLRILGFLLYDTNLNLATDYIIVTNNYNATNEFWDGLVHRLTPYLKYFVKHHLNTEEELIEFKDFMCIYVAILENKKLKIDELYKFSISIYEKYCLVASNAFAAEFQSLLNDDDFMPLTINDRSLFDRVTKICWLKDEDEHLAEKANPNDFVVALPFSPLYPMTCTLIKKTYTKLTSFTLNHFRHELHTINSILVKTVDYLFNDVVNKSIHAKLDTTSREEIAQILINLDYFIVAAQKFSRLMAKENIMQNPDIEIKLSSIKHYEESRKYAETKLINLIDSKITDILETIDLDWQSTETREDPDFIIVDIAQFLEMMFSSTLVNLPYSVQTLLIFREFDSLTTQFLDMLLTGSSDGISKASVLNFEVDIKYLKGIIPKIFPVEESSDTEDLNRQGQTPVLQQGTSTSLIENNIKSLEATFTELDQCIELLKSENSNEYADPEVRMRKYARIRPEDASLLLQKIRSASENSESSESSMSSNRMITPGGTLNSARIAKFFNRA